MDSGSKKFKSRLTDWLFKWVDISKKKEYPNGWLQKKTIQIQKDHRKELTPATDNMLTYEVDKSKQQRTKEIYYLLIYHRLFSKEQKGCDREARGTGDLLYIDQYILKRVKRGEKCNHGID